MQRTPLRYVPCEEIRDLTLEVSRRPSCAMAISIARFALDQNSMREPVIDQVLELARANPVDSATRESLEQRVRQLDDVYFNAQEAGEEYESAFRRARAVNSAMHALDSNPEVAVVEAIYEAAAAVPDRVLFARFLKGLLAT